MKMFAPFRRDRSIAAIVAFGFIMLAGTAHADFVNGNFEDPTAFSGWTENSYRNNGIPVFPPATEADLGLAAGSGPMSAVLDPSSSPAPGSTGGVDPAVQWGNRVARVHDEINGDGQTVSSIEQTLVLTASDVDTDGKVHVRFEAAPVLEDPGHSPENQPYFFIEISKVGGGSLYHTFNFAGESGVPWSTAGGYTYTDWQAFDIALDPGVAGPGDTIKIKMIAAGCEPSAHAAALYVDNVRTSLNVTGASLWVAATGPATTCLTGGPVTYTYTYANNGTEQIDNVQVTLDMPQTTDPLPADFISITNPTFGGGTCAAPTTPGSPAICAIGTLMPGESGTFSMTVGIPAGAVGTSLNNGSYTIDGISAVTSNPVSQLGPLVRTTLEATCVTLPSFVPVPTLGGWVLLLLSGLLALFAVVFMRREQRS